MPGAAAASRSRGASLRPACITSVLFSLMAATYAVIGATPSPLMSLGFSFAPLFAQAAWVRRDARVWRVPLSYDWGFFMLAAWPVFLPWYAFATRGRAGFRLAAGLVALLAGPSFVLGVISTLSRK